MDYRELLLLWAARETGVLEAITVDVGTPEAVAAETGVTERAARVTIEALADRGFLTRMGDEYEITNRALGFVTRTDVRSVGPVPHQLDCIERARSLPETMRTGEPPAKPDDWTANRLGAIAATDEATIRAVVTAAVRERPDATAVLDVGGGPGVYAKEFVRRGFEVTLYERPAVVEAVSGFLEHEPVELVAGERLGTLPDGFDLAFAATLTHRLGPAENRRLVRNVADALELGGVAVFVDYVRGRSDFATTAAAHALAQTRRGQSYEESEYVDWFESAGFERPRVDDVPGTELQAITARRRAIQ